MIGLQISPPVGLRRQERFYLLVADARFSAGQIIQATFLHPTLQFFDFSVELIEGIDHKEQALITVVVEIGMNRPFKLKRGAEDIW